MVIRKGKLLMLGYVGEINRSRMYLVKESIDINLELVLWAAGNCVLEEDPYLFGERKMYSRVEGILFEEWLIKFDFITKDLPELTEDLVLNNMVVFEVPSRGA